MLTYRTMRKNALVLLAVIVVLMGFSFVNALPSIDPEIMKAFENNYSSAEVWIKYRVDTPINESNEEEMIAYYQNITISKLAFSYIPESEMNITRATLLGFAPNFVAIVNKQGFEKMATDSRVTEISLLQKAYLADNPQNQTLPYVDPAILTYFEQNQTWVGVLVILVDNTNITITGTRAERLNMTKYKNQILKATVEEFILNYSSNEVVDVHTFPREFSAEITRQGFDKLINDYGVSEIYLAYNGTSSGSNNIQIIENQAENQTEIKSPEPAKPQSFFQRVINFFKSLFRLK